MIRLKIFVIAFFVSLSGIFAQTAVAPFEGEVVYTNTYKSKNPKLEDKRLANMLGKVHNYFIKGGDYKTVTNGMFAQWQLYINKENRIYNKMASSDTVFWNNAAEHDDQVLSAKINKNVTTILGYVCDELILTCGSGVQKFYYSSKLKVDSKLFTKHQYGNYYNYVSRTNAIPLKTIIEDPEFTMESVATEIKPGKLDPKMFQLFPGTKTAKSAY